MVWSPCWRYTNPLLPPSFILIQITQLNLIQISLGLKSNRLEFDKHHRKTFALFFLLNCMRNQLLNIVQMNFSFYSIWKPKNDSFEIFLKFLKKYFRNSQDSEWTHSDNSTIFFSFSFSFSLSLKQTHKSIIRKSFKWLNTISIFDEYSCLEQD
jgi:hypothetical protein